MAYLMRTLLPIIFVIITIINTQQIKGPYCHVSSDTSYTSKSAPPKVHPNPATLLIQELRPLLIFPCQNSPPSCDKFRERKLSEILEKQPSLTDDKRDELVRIVRMLWELDLKIRKLGIKNVNNGTKEENSMEDLAEKGEEDAWESWFETYERWSKEIEELAKIKREFRATPPWWKEKRFVLRLFVGDIPEKDR
ncbi:hypothetical protein V8E51_018310 [Hyaloscypha variabilis]